ncbi:TorF family putative porin [Massilia glaciei]|uniref:Choline dehydrogenase n=1 Tax=Massilia glaciei TaxID=1524097 RepID=A0A2U2HIF9_9BURK|nr:TorF family putative porin [Massilia glaciei]PWF46135.1 choline dehydrogenase [Massilia glaciei]
MKPTLNTLMLAPVLALAAAFAQAQTPEPAPSAELATTTGNVTLASQYISRGYQQTWGKPALQGGLDYAHPSGFSIGTWGSTISSKMIEGGSLELDLYGGYAGSMSDIGYTAMVYYYIYPGAKISSVNVKYDYGELSLGVNYKIFSAKYNHTFTKDYFGFSDARGTGYLDLNTNFDVGSGFGLQFHFGMGRVRNWPDYDWRDYKIALTRTFSNGWMAMAAVTKGNAPSGVYDNYPATTPNSSGVTEISQPLKTNAVISVTKSF